MAGNTSLIGDEQWAAISAEVQDTTGLRFRLEAAGSRWRASIVNRAKSSGEAMKQSRNVEAVARKLLALMRADDEGREAVIAIAERERKRTEVAEAGVDLEQIALGRPAKNSDVSRLRLYRDVLEAWVQAGGTVARTVNGGKEGGKCVRFLSVVLPVLMGDEAPEQTSIGRLVKEWQKDAKFTLGGGAIVTTHLAGKTTITRHESPNGRDRTRK